jgi:hypothetical protein
MSARHHRGYRPQEDWLPDDAQALHLEAQGLWRRAAARWQHVLLREADDRVIEAILQRHDACLRQAIRQRLPAGDVTASADSGVATGMDWLPNGPDLWRTA